MIIFKCAVTLIYTDIESKLKYTCLRPFLLPALIEILVHFFFVSVFIILFLSFSIFSGTFMHIFNFLRHTFKRKNAWKADGIVLTIILYDEMISYLKHKNTIKMDCIWFSVNEFLFVIGIYWMKIRYEWLMMLEKIAIREIVEQNWNACFHGQSSKCNFYNTCIILFIEIIKWIN